MLVTEYLVWTLGGLTLGSAFDNVIQMTGTWKSAPSL